MSEYDGSTDGASRLQRPLDCMLVHFTAIEYNYLIVVVGVTSSPAALMGSRFHTASTVRVLDITDWILHELVVNFYLHPQHACNRREQLRSRCRQLMNSTKDLLKSCLILAHWPHYVKTCHPKNQKYIMYCTGQSHGYR